MRGFSETEVVEDVQEALQTLQNMTIDNVHLTTMRGVTYREGSVSDPNAIELKPRFKWPVQDHDDIRPFEIQPIASDVFTERQRLLADLQLVSGVNPYVSGSDMGSVDQNTATGVTALQEVASRLLRFKAGIIQYKGYQRTFEQWAEMVKQFAERGRAVRAGAGIPDPAGAGACRRGVRHAEGRPLRCPPGSSPGCAGTGAAERERLAATARRRHRRGAVGSADRRDDHERGWDAVSAVDDFNDLVERVHAVAEMTETTGWDFLRDRMVVDMAKVQQMILRGKLERDEYLRLTGEYAGMRRWLEMPAQMARELDVERASLVEEVEALEAQVEAEV
jgi:hypothetical protein